MTDDQFREALPRVAEQIKLAASSLTPYTARCDSCRWWDRQSSTGGYCKTKAPILVKREDFGCETVWPWTKEAEFCGDHVRKRGTTDRAA